MPKLKVTDQNKKILLVQAISMEGIDIERVYPIGLVTIGTYLERCGRYDPVLFDMNTAIDPYGELAQLIRTEKPDAVGLSFRNVDPLGNRTTSLVVPLMITASFIRKRIGNIPLFIGGTAFSLFPERLIREIPELDFGFAGEAEDWIVPLADAMFAGDGGTALRKIPGCVYRTDAGKNSDAGENTEAVKAAAKIQTSAAGETDDHPVHMNPRAPGFDMRNYQMIDRSLLDPKKYLELNAYVESIGVETKRGCVYSCAYCSYPLLQGNCMRLRDPDSVVDELAYIQNEYGAERIHFTDSIVNFPPEHFDTVCRRMIERGVKLKWSGFFRENLLTPERVRLYADAGCECFSLSPDGLTQKSLDLLGKRLTTDEIVEAAEVLAETGVTSVYHFLVNTPQTDENEIREARKLIERIYQAHARTKSIGTIVLNLIRILPDTRIEQIAHADGNISDTTDLLYPVYYDPEKYRTLRYSLEVWHQKMNIEMWQTEETGCSGSTDDKINETNETVRETGQTDTSQDETEETEQTDEHYIA
ncbi:MAG: radical SAM protein [Eubacteriaceae bacterium]|jgi:anaerobic magnesium-protoporphyrin IX monomethyl ester cyclase